MNKNNEPHFTLQDLSPILWKESIVKIFKEFQMSESALGWSLIGLERYLPRKMPNGEIFVDKISKSGWEWVSYKSLVKPKKAEKTRIKILKPKVERMLIAVLIYYISNCTVHELIHLMGEIYDESKVYHMTYKLLEDFTEKLRGDNNEK